MPDLLTTRQVQDLLQVDRTTIYRMVESNQLPAIRVGKQWRFERGALDRWLSGQSAGTETGPAHPAHPAPDLAPAARATAPAAGTSAALYELLPVPVVQPLQDAFADALCVTIVITDLQGQPLTHVSNACGLYAAMLHDVDSVARCIQDWQNVAGVVPIEPRFSPNDLGLLCARGLIRVGNELKGMVFVGGIAPDVWPPTDEQIQLVAERFGVAPDYVAENIEGVHRLDRRQRDRVLSFVQRIADIVSQLLEDRGALTSRLQTIAALIATVER